jgi:hypothetical protein
MASELAQGGTIFMLTLLTKLGLQLGLQSIVSELAKLSMSSGNRLVS